MYSMRFCPTETDEAEGNRAENTSLFLYLFLLRHINVVDPLNTADIPILIHEYN